MRTRGAILSRLAGLHARHEGLELPHGRHAPLTAAASGFGGRTVAGTLLQGPQCGLSIRLQLLRITFLESRPRSMDCDGLDWVVPRLRGSPVLSSGLRAILKPLREAHEGADVLGVLAPEGNRHAGAVVVGALRQRVGVVVRGPTQCSQEIADYLFGLVVRAYPVLLGNLLQLLACQLLQGLLVPMLGETRGGSSCWRHPCCRVEARQLVALLGRLPRNCFSLSDTGRNEILHVGWTG
mmetsp:Transcript_22517/g.62466  ORF Transcript_22517/g.62466 Transcript_22517/m.62466 type:complete len:238 (+) Transcript_22517:430-1143(+)